MPSKRETLKFKRLIHAPPAEAYRAFTNNVALRDWLCDVAQVDARKGGGLFLSWNDGSYAVGKFLICEPGQTLVLAWHHSREPEPAKVQVRFAEKSGGTELTLKHEAGSGRKWAEAVKAAWAAWESALENLESMLETGIDLRIARMPRLGIFIDEFNAEIAGRLGAPVTAGVRLAGVADGTGAQAAGLQQNDVIVQLAGKKMTGFGSVVSALQGHKAGDFIKAVFYRDGEKKTATLELSARALPSIPPLDELVETVRKHYAEIDAGLAQLLEGVPEEQAGRRPAPDAWSVKDAIAHFILTERDTQSWFAQMLNGGDIGESLEFRPNVEARVRALRKLYLSVPALLDELKRSEAETLALLAALPPEFLARKHLYRRVTSWMLDVIPSHFKDEHLGLMQSALQSARAPG